jgi:SAM-dependent methyltransferase
MVQSLEHTSDPRAAVRNCVRHLKPGGALWIEVPNHDCVGFRHRGPVWFHTDAGRHMHFFAGLSLQTLMREEGLAIVDVCYSGYVRQFTWLSAEQAVWNALYGGQLHGAQRGAPAFPKSSALLRLLGATLLASPSSRFDSVRVVAVKRPDGGSA